MTIAQIKSRVRNNLNDAGITFYTDADLTDALQDGYDEIAVISGCIEKQADVNFAPNTTYYNMRTLIPDYYRPIRLYNPAIKQYMELLDDRINLSYRQDWELATHTSRDGMILGPDYLGISGRSANPVGHFKLWYTALAPTINDSLTPRINSAYQILLEHYGTGDLLEQNEEFKKALTYWEQYETLLQEYTNKIQLLAKADRIFTRS